ncbi:MAG TPA: acetate kinase [Gallionellaceae bacterium]|nr:acetate kinase [Gallionellaceae bacterium]
MTTILSINSGSSSVKASLFTEDGLRNDFRYDHLSEPQSGFDQLLRDLSGHAPDIVGHRFVHGGEVADAARLVDTAERNRLGQIIHLAPLHLPGNLMGLDICRKRFIVPQVACFDTAFHMTLPDLAKRLPIPQEFGLRRFGFHGLNYAYVASQLLDILGNVAYGRIVVAHLGSGASLCLLENLTSVDTTMGYTPAGGIPMGTRSGDLDPGVMLELAKRCKATQLSDLVFHKMGLLALSNGESSEMKDLLSSGSAHAKFAVDYFCRQVRAAIGSLAAKSGGIDALVFTGGIGEHSPQIREAICKPLDFLGFSLNKNANNAALPRIERKDSKPIIVIPADEEAMIHRLCLAFILETSD